VISVIIPAKNEAATINRLLSSLADAASRGELEVIVVCNGCVDHTADVARSYRNVLVIETNISSKTNALNLGDQVATGFPRFYIDADVVVSVDGIGALGDRLARGDVLAAAPRAKNDTTECSWMVRSFFQIAAMLPSANEGIGGSGVFALSSSGRQRFASFPEVVADDAYVRLQFSADECETLNGVTALVFPPRRLFDLIKVRTRIRYGHLELEKGFPDLWAAGYRGNDKSVLRLLMRVSLWPKLAIFIGVTAIARFRARRRLWQHVRLWEQDRTSRKPFVSSCAIQDVPRAPKEAVGGAARQHSTMIDILRH
jgi:glycosyltransferase involved in cell wall biosynthesis